eukprot:360018-Chlamydomonas_euryale.AAC.6
MQGVFTVRTCRSVTIVLIDRRARLPPSQRSARASTQHAAFKLGACSVRILLRAAVFIPRVEVWMHLGAADAETRPAAAVLPVGQTQSFGICCLPSRPTVASSHPVMPGHSRRAKQRQLSSTGLVLETGRTSGVEDRPTDITAPMRTPRTVNCVCTLVRVRFRVRITLVRVTLTRTRSSTKARGQELVAQLQHMLPVLASDTREAREVNVPGYLRQAAKLGAPKERQLIITNYPSHPQRPDNRSSPDPHV